MISVIVPNYNHAQYLEKRIDSILNQTIQDFELIILDDHSTDTSKEVIERYRTNPKVKAIVYNETNSGSVFKQWQKGITLARGQYIWIAESDDWAEPGFLEELLKVFQQEEKLLMVYSDSRIFNEEEQNSNMLFSDRRNQVAPGLWTNDYIKEGRTQLEESLSDWCSVNNASAVLFKSEALKNLQIDLNHYNYAGDWAVYVDIALRGKIGYRHLPLSNYRDHAQNASKNATRQGKIFIEQFRIRAMYWSGTTGINKKEFLKRKARALFEIRRYVRWIDMPRLILKMLNINTAFFLQSFFTIIRIKIGIK